MESTFEIKYGLLYQGKILGYTIESNCGGSDCVPEQYELDQYAKNEWLVDTPEHAEYVRQFSTDWYNARYGTPTNPYDKNDVQVVRVERRVTQTPSPTHIPTFEEMMNFKYKEKNPEYLAYILEEYRRNPHKMACYNIYDLELWREAQDKSRRE